jgi:N-methylhydantoinase A/oxoprolinase/acetone carboxylase beta subunit/N-methylhydantoinase B/oxoprolinase/acetone carboxylase alpha subunit/very-short-patch-repair endonuclease
MNDSRWQFWIDRGGTFTDIVARTPQGTLVTHKLLSENPERYQDAAVQGIRTLLNLRADEPIPAAQIEAVKMGTTVATNALLERKGERTLLVVTRGFKDQLRIAYQNRPKLFVRKIELPELLYSDVVEVNERIGAHGDVVQTLDIPAAQIALKSAYFSGIRSVAICLMHGYRFTQHEAALKKIAQEIGFTQISVSHEVSPLMKFVSRGDTTVVDAYLSPILRRYVNQVQAALNNTLPSHPGRGTEGEGTTAATGGSDVSSLTPAPLPGGEGFQTGVRLQFMQSSGGLTDAHHFHGKDAILSGPAGGIVGAVAVTQLAGFDKMIGFDMGGTSTDVSHFAGEYERAFVTEVAGVRLRAPIMQIHTVAAGGGSICFFDGSKFRVGPESAGANPGPAAYRRGGPLTVTDCNVMVGKLRPELFPAVFGRNGDETLDSCTVIEKFEVLALEVNRATGATKTPEEIAAGFLQIAVENMANAIKHVSVARGYDVTEYTLTCFGGAGGQHACLVADALGMERVYIHPFAGVLSAYGMGLADVRTIKQSAVEAQLSDEKLASLAVAFSSLSDAARTDVRTQGIPAAQIRVVERVSLKYSGTDTTIELPVTRASQTSELVAAFEATYKQRYGFLMPNRALVIESVNVEAIGATQSAAETAPQVSARKNALAPHATVRAYMAGAAQDVCVYLREAMQAGDVIDGPAIIKEPNATTIIEPEWRVTVTPLNHLVLTRAVAKQRAHAIGTTADPVLLEVFNNLFMAIAEQMGVTLANTSYSVNIKERLDFSCAIFDPEANLVANAPHMPVHLGSMGESVRVVLKNRAGTMKRGDAFVVNAPYAGGTHIPDVTVVMPVYAKDLQEFKNPSPSGRGELKNPSPPGRGAGVRENVSSRLRLDAIPTSLLENARSLRLNQTDAEQLLWAILRNRSFGDLKFRRQHPVLVSGKRYVLDFFCEESRIAIELDGGQHTDAIDRDSRRDALLAEHGVATLRYWNHEVLVNTELVLSSIWDAVFPSPLPLSQRERGSSSQPSPPGGGSFVEQPLFYVASRGHHADIGGITPGSMPPFSKHISEEGVLLDNVQLVREGVFLEDELTKIFTQDPLPVRNVTQNIADLRAQVASCGKGAAELIKMVEHFGQEVVVAYMKHVQDNAEESVRRVIHKLHDGEFGVDLDDGSHIHVKLSIDKVKREATVDFTGTSAQRPSNFNAPRPVSQAVVLYVFRTLVDADIPMNAGCLKPIHIVIPEGSMLSPKYPAAVVAGNVEVSQAATNCLYGALGVLAGAYGTMTNFTFGNDVHQYYETIAGGSGAGEGFDGTSVVQCHMTNSRLTDPEVLEFRYPVRVDAHTICAGTGGAGKWKGGDGADRRIRFLEPLTAAILGNNRKNQPHGMAGGAPGASAKNWLERADGAREDFGHICEVSVGKDDVFVIQTPGGGGFGEI